MNLMIILPMDKLHLIPMNWLNRKRMMPKWRPLLRLRFGWASWAGPGNWRCVWHVNITRYFVSKENFVEPCICSAQSLQGKDVRREAGHRLPDEKRTTCSWPENNGCYYYLPGVLYYHFLRLAQRFERLILASDTIVEYYRLTSE